jgi:hypothetical protein
MMETNQVKIHKTDGERTYAIGIKREGAESFEILTAFGREIPVCSDDKKLMGEADRYIDHARDHSRLMRGPYRGQVREKVERIAIDITALLDEGLIDPKLLKRL